MAATGQPLQARSAFASGRTTALISVVVPVFNEEITIRESHQRLARALDDLKVNGEIIYVDDGSADQTTSLLKEIRETDARVCIIELSRNFGKEAAMSAGLDQAHGDAVIVMDADLQDPPELIPLMYEEWLRGYDVVYMKRRSRAGETAFKKFTAHTFYRLLNKLSRVKIPADVGDFRLLSASAVAALRRLPERNRYMKGLFAWIGFPQKELLYDRDARVGGRTKWKLGSLVALSLDGITSFSTAPLRIASLMGVLSASVAFLYGMWVVTKTLLFGEIVRGYPTMMVIILFLGGIQLIAIGVLGEYLGRMFMETKQRPLYFVKQLLPAQVARGVKDDKKVKKLADGA